MTNSPRRTRHLIFLAHLWTCAPFLVLWLMVPEARAGLSEDSYHHLCVFIPLVVVYLVVRTLFAFKEPRWLNWEYVCPPIDVAMVTCLMYLGDRNPLSNASLLYLFPLAEAACTLNVMWALSVAAMVALGVIAFAPTWPPALPVAVGFRYFLIFILGSLVAMLSRAAARQQAELRIARDRNRIAMEMHDGVQGHLVAIASRLELLGRVVAQDPTRAAELASDTRESTRDAADELRFLVQRLRAPSLEQGFLPALKQYAHNVTDRCGLELVFETEGEPYPLAPDVENALFRVAQEALTNVIRHAQAKRVTVAAQFAVDAVQLVVRDDGRGFEPEEGADEDTPAGLAGMKERLERIHGELRVESKPGEGAAIMALVPAKEATRRKGQDEQ